MEGTRKKWAVYTIRERQGLEKPFWMRVGVGFINRDGSFNLHLDATPLDGKLHMREWQEETAFSTNRNGSEALTVAEPRRPRGKSPKAAAADAAEAAF